MGKKQTIFCIADIYSSIGFYSGGMSGISQAVPHLGKIWVVCIFDNLGPCKAPLILFIIITISFLWCVWGGRGGGSITWEVSPGSHEFQCFFGKMVAALYLIEEL